MVTAAVEEYRPRAIGDRLQQHCAVLMIWQLGKQRKIHGMLTSIEARPKIRNGASTCWSARPARPAHRRHALSVSDDAAYRLARVHQVESLIDVIEGELVRDQVVDIYPSLHVPVDDLRHVAAAARAAEGSAFPYPPGDQLERPRADFLSGAGHADDDGDAPAFMAAFERLAHDLDVAYAFEAVVGAAVSQTDEVGHQIAPNLVGIDEVGHAHFFRQRLALGIDVDTDDHVSAGQAGALDHVQAYTAQTEYDDVGARFNLGRIDHRAYAGGHAAADVTDLVERRVRANLGQGNLRHHGVVGESRSAHVVEQLFLDQRKTAAAIGHHPLPLRDPDCLA